MERRQITVDQARALRLVRLGLAPDAPGAPVLHSPGDVVAHHLAMQAQDFPAIQWAIASRLAGGRLPSSAVLDAFDRGEIVKTWPMRGTMHVVAAADGRWLLDLCGPVVLRGARRRHEHLGIDAAFVDRVESVARRLLADAPSVTRDELIAACVAEGMDFAESQRRYHSVWYLCQTGTTVLGPIRNGDNTLVLSDRHLPSAARLDESDALDRLAARYLAARAPARVDDLQHWTRLTKTQCRRAFAAISDELVAVDVVNEHRPRRDASAAPLGDLVAPAAHLAHVDDLHFGGNVPRVVVLAGFDEHLLGYRDRSLVLEPAHARHVDPGGNGVFRYTVVFDGRVVGTWKRRLLTSTAPVEVTLFDRAASAHRPLIAAAFEPWGEFVGKEPVITFTS